MKSIIKKYWWFTLLEMLVVTIVIWIIFPVMIEVYGFMIKANKEIVARENAIQQWYEFFEKLNILIQDYTIDYEEYYNRQMVWCVNSWWLLTWDNFKWNIWLSGYCTEFTAYWNENSTERVMQWDVPINGAFHDLYECTSWDAKNINGRPRMVNKCWRFGNKQSFGQYKSLFKDAKNFGTYTDDEDLWRIVNNDINAIEDSDNIQELYLISQDGKSRLFFRRKLTSIQTWFAQYRIQMLRLRWFDAWQAHDFDSPTNIEWLYDWQIDTWACDTSMWFIWGGQSVWWAYSGYYLPKDVDDCWIDLTYWSTSVYTRNIVISPLWDPDLFWAEQDRQINPYMKILLVNGVYFPIFAGNTSIGSSIESFKVPLQTTINMKNFYE